MEKKEKYFKIKEEKKKSSPKPKKFFDFFSHKQCLRNLGWDFILSLKIFLM